MNSSQRQLILTDDGSHSVVMRDMNVTYHSTHGAIRESQHVFIGAGLNRVKEIFPHEPLHMLEMGFGTGLNAFLTAIEAYRHPYPISYSAIEAYPLEMATAAALNYPDYLGHEDIFSNLHVAPWNAAVSIHDSFSIYKLATDLLDYTCRDKFHLIYFDAFAPEAQPQLWTEAVFHKLAGCMHPGGILVTYCSKGIVRRAMQAAGWQVAKLPGPPGKREMVRAVYPG